MFAAMKSMLNKWAPLGLRHLPALSSASVDPAKLYKGFLFQKIYLRLYFNHFIPWIIFLHIKLKISVDNVFFINLGLSQLVSYEQVVLNFLRPL